MGEAFIYENNFCTIPEMKIKFVLFSLMLISSFVYADSPDQVLLKTCIDSDDEVFQLNYKISETDDRIINGLIDEKVARFNIEKGLLNGMSQEKIDYWVAFEVSSKNNVDKLMKERITLVKSVIKEKYQLARICSRRKFLHSDVEQVCKSNNMKTKRWCQSKFF